MSGCQNSAAMEIKRIVPDIESTDFDASREFYEDFLGLEPLMDQGWVMKILNNFNDSNFSSV